MDTIKNFLLKIDGFLLKYWKLPTFLYCILIFIVTAYGRRDFFKSYPTEWNKEFAIVIAPILIIFLWKRIFHPGD